MYTTSGSATDPLLPVIQGANAPAYLTWRAFGARLASALLIVTTSCAATLEVWLPPSDDTPPPLLWPIVAFTALAAALVITEAVARRTHRRTYNHGVHDGESASALSAAELRDQATLVRCSAISYVEKIIELKLTLDLQRAEKALLLEQWEKRKAAEKAREEMVRSHRRRCPDRTQVWQCPHTQTWIAASERWGYFGEKLVKRRAAKKEKDLSATRLTPRS